MLWILLALAVGYVPAYLVHDYLTYKPPECSCGEGTRYRVVAFGVPSTYCPSCDTTTGLARLLEQVLQGVAETFEVDFPCRWVAFGRWTSFPSSWWCWAFHGHETHEDCDHGPQDLP